jgi:hypothetical protein
MISDFIFVALKGKNSNQAEFTCSLPRIDSNDDCGIDKMEECGHAILKKDPDGFYDLSIEMFDNIKSLCDNDVYDREILLDAIVFMVKQSCDFDKRKTRVCFQDYIGMIEKYS